MKYCLFTLFLSMGALFCQAQEMPQWGNLEPGKYKVGYKTIRVTDETRNYIGTGRPLQFYVWYPASVKAGEKPMRYGAYFDDVGYDWGNDPETVRQLRQSVENDFKHSALMPSYPGGLHDTTVSMILKTPVPVYRMAPPAQGPFPVLLHAHAHGLLHQSVLLEYLASHGYVVVSVSAYGSSPAFYGRGEDGNNALLDLSQDLAVALTEARKLPFADAGRVAMIGMMAQGGLSLQLREMPLNAIACLDCDWRPQELKKLPYFDTRKIRIPLLELVNTEFREQQFSFLDSLPYAERFVGRFVTFVHGDFYPFPKIARPAESKGFRNYEYMARYTLRFLNGIFSNDTSAQSFRKNPAKNDDFPPGYIFVRKREALPPIPTENEFLTWLRFGKTDKARETWNSFGKAIFSKPDNLFFTAFFLVRNAEPAAFDAIKIYTEAYPDDPRSPGLLNRLTYDLLGKKQIEKARESATLFIQTFPASPYAVCAMASVEFAAGNRAKAKELAQKTIEITRESNLQEREKEYLRQSAENILYSR